MFQQHIRSIETLIWTFMCEWYSALDSGDLLHVPGSRWPDKELPELAS